MINANAVALPNGMDMESYINHNEQMLDLMKSASEIVMYHGLASATIPSNSTYTPLNIAKSSQWNFSNDAVSLNDDGTITVKDGSLAAAIFAFEISNTSSNSATFWIKMQYQNEGSSAWNDWDNSIKRFALPANTEESHTTAIVMTPGYPICKYRAVITSNVSGITFSRRQDVLVLGLVKSQQ